MNWLFQKEIYDWKSWSQVFQSIEVFEPMIRHILNSESLPCDGIKRCKAGTNAVFYTGGYVVKIYAPMESGMDMESDFRSELFGMERAHQLGIPSPRLVAQGMVDDRYKFRYLVMEYIDGQPLGDVDSAFCDVEKTKIGHELRSMTKRLNTACNSFNDVDIIQRELNNKRWSSLPDSFNRERIDYLKQFVIEAPVYVHGDLNPDNVLLDDNGELYIIDFADALLAPMEYELPAMVCELFNFDKAYMKGYFGEESPECIADKCLAGLLMHDFGSTIIECNFGSAGDIGSIAVLRERLLFAIETGEQWKE